jgi:hypothetical protein
MMMGVVLVDLDRADLAAQFDPVHPGHLHVEDEAIEAETRTARSGQAPPGPDDAVVKSV